MYSSTIIILLFSILASLSPTSSFTPPALQTTRPQPRPPTSLNFFQQVPTDPDKKKPMDYVCKDCGYVFSKGTIGKEEARGARGQKAAIVASYLILFIQYANNPYSSLRSLALAAWDKLDNSKYQCPPCGAGKFRFKKVPKGSEKGEIKIKKSWF